MVVVVGGAVRVGFDGGAHIRQARFEVVALQLHKGLGRAHGAGLVVACGQDFGRALGLSQGLQVQSEGHAQGVGSLGVAHDECAQ